MRLDLDQSPEKILLQAYHEFRENRLVMYNFTLSYVLMKLIDLIEGGDYPSECLELREVVKELHDNCRHNYASLCVLITISELMKLIMKYNDLVNQIKSQQVRVIMNVS